MVAVVVVAVVTWVLVASRPVQIDYYTVVDDGTIAVHVSSGRRDWCRTTDVSETRSDIRISVACMFWPIPFPQLAIAVDREVIVRLAEPLRDRDVHDGKGPPLPTARPGPPLGYLPWIDAEWSG